MTLKHGIRQRWQNLSITTKFSSAFGILLSLMVLVALSSYLALIAVRRKTEAAILTSTEIQRLVLEMDRSLQEARRLERDFFVRYQTIGFTQAYRMYAKQADEKIAEAVDKSEDLQQLISQSNVSEALRHSDVNLNLYLSASSRYQATFKEAVELVAKLAAEDTGLQERLAQQSTGLLNLLQAANTLEAIVLYREMQSLEKDYLLTRQRPFMQSAFNVADELQGVITTAPALTTVQQQQALTNLEAYLAIAEEILKQDVAIHSKFNEFDLQAEAIDPISEELIALADREVERAQARIEQTSHLATTILIVTALVGLGLAASVAKLLNTSITCNVVKLTQVTSQWQTGNLDERACIESGDELGQLADSFNGMATRLRALVSNLEQKVAERTQELSQALAHLQTTQQELVQSEKMAALGQLIAGVAHEINTPLGAIRASVENITTFLDENLEQLPGFFQSLPPEYHPVFLELLAKSTRPSMLFSSKEKRKFKRRLIRQLEERGIAEADTVADTLVDIGVYDDVEAFLSLITAPNSQILLNTAYQLSTLRKSTQTITTAIDRAAKVVFALKTYARYDQTGEMIQANVIEGIETVLTLYHNQLKKGVEVIRHYHEVPLIFCYPDELNQVWTNLIHNALHAMDNRGTLTIEVTPDETNVSIKITDTGKGIPPEILPKIFHPFFTTKPPGEGSGLGLDIVKKIVEKHQSFLEVASQPGCTTFTVSLPRHLELNPNCLPSGDEVSSMPPCY